MNARSSTTEKVAPTVSIQTPSPASDNFRSVLRDRRTIIGSVITGVVLLIAIFGPLFAPHAVDAYVGSPFAGPSASTPLGVDVLGQDVLSRVLNGGRTIVWMSLVASALGVIGGVLLGMIAGFVRGFVGEIIMRGCEIWMALPMIIFILIIIALFGRAPWLLVLLVALGHVPQVTRVIYGAVLDVSQREYVESAVASGSRVFETARTHILPSLVPVVMVEFGLRVVWSVGMLAGLALLGLGVAPPAADWGLMINENRGGLSAQPLAILIPLALITLFAVGVNLITEGVGRSLGLAEGTTK
ncbi:MAG TPA: ABC transporter permease [Pseudolysinimonas sp.]|nr:ABC transporter permease [Pseudolysinimonas sp.]